MGDRGNIVVKGHGGSVFLYSHWAGSELPNVVRDALAKKWRWQDDCYLTRIIFDVMTDKHHGEETGFGIGASMGDNSHDFVVVNVAEQTVSYVPEKDNGMSPTAKKSWPFAHFAKLTDKELTEDFK